MKPRQRSVFPDDDDLEDPSLSHRVNGGGTRPGTFKRGNKCASGRRVNRDVIAAAFREAISADDLQELARMLLERALKRGDVSAAREILDRVVGKARPGDAPPTPIDLQLDTSSLEGCQAAMAKVITAVTTGKVSLETGASLASLVAHARGPTDVTELRDELHQLQELLREKKKAEAHAWK